MVEVVVLNDLGYEGVPCGFWAFFPSGGRVKSSVVENVVLDGLGCEDSAPGLWAFFSSGGRVKALMVADAVLDDLMLSPGLWVFGGWDRAV